MKGDTMNLEEVEKGERARRIREVLAELPQGSRCRRETRAAMDHAEVSTQEAEVAASGVRSGGSMKTPLKILSAAALLLVLLFVGPIVYRTGQRWSLYLNCPDYGSNDDAKAQANAQCWEKAGRAVMYGGRWPRR
jgi:hypothetical protein